MPKSTFNNLSDERQKEILNACRAEFEANKLHDASVANIINRLGIARGTFYKYFKDIEDCYFYILSTETKEMHEIFVDLLKEEKFDLVLILEKYGDMLADEIHKKDNYELYKNKYLGWTPDVQIRWDNYCNENKVKKANIRKFGEANYSKETIHLIKAVVHNLVERNFTEKWTKKKFLKKYKKQLEILKRGIRR